METLKVYLDNSIVEGSENDTNNKKLFINILSFEDLSSQVMDTVYTDKDCWLELRIDRQMLYQHWRNGQTESYPISSGNKSLEKGIESRPGLFAIFYKSEHHQSTQFNNADMYHFMPFNMGIGFHSLDGTGYYGNLGRVPSSHGCIRMRHEDAAKIYKDCPLGTLVLAHKGKTIRTIGFAPKDYQNPVEYAKDDYKIMLSKNLYNILKGDYYLSERYYFVIDPEVIPKAGIYIAYDRNLTEQQKFPVKNLKIIFEADRLRPEKIVSKSIQYIDTDSVSEYFSDLFDEDESDTGNGKNEILDDKELIKEYFNNPIGILPYYGPNR